MTDTAAGVLTERRSYVAGRWVEGDRTFGVENPADETVFAQVPVTPLTEIQTAIERARESFDSGIWADRPARERAAALHAFLDAVETMRDEVIATCVAEAGQPAWFAEMTQVGPAMTLSRETIDLYLSMSHEETNPVPVDELTRGRVVLSVRRYEPVGVVAAITPYNAAFLMAFQKLIPALMAGNSVVLRPSPLTPLSSLVLRRGGGGGRTTPGVLQRRRGGRSGRCGTADHAPGRRHGVVHRVDGGGPADPRPGGADGEARRARARRQVGADLPAGRGAPGRRRCARPWSRAPAVRPASPPPGCWSRKRARPMCSAAVAATYGSLVGRPADPAGHDARPGHQRRAARPVRAIRRAGRGARRQGRDRRPPTGRTRPRLLLRADRARRAGQCQSRGAGGDLRSGAHRDRLPRRRRRRTDRQRPHLRPVGSGVRSRPGSATAVARRIRSGAVNVNAGGLFSAYAPSGGYKQSGLGRERGPDGIRAFQEVKHMSIGELPHADRSTGGTEKTMTAELNLDWLISVDDHILEPPNLWVDRVPAKDRDRAPHMIRRWRRGLGLRRQAFPDFGPVARSPASPRRSSAPSRCRTRRCARAATTPRRVSRTWTAPASLPRCASRP